MVNFSPLAAEIGSLVGGTPVNFNGFRVLAALLHRTLGASAKLCGVEQRAPLIFGRAAITLGIYPSSSLVYYCLVPSPVIKLSTVIRLSFKKRILCSTIFHEVALVEPGLIHVLHGELAIA